MDDIRVARPVFEMPRHEKQPQPARPSGSAVRSREDQDQVRVRAAAEPLLTGESPRAIVSPRRCRLVGTDVGAARLLGEKHRGRHVMSRVVREPRHEPRRQLTVVQLETARHRIHHPDGAAGDRLIGLQEHVEHRGHQRARCPAIQAAPTRGVGSAYRTEAEHGALELLVCGMELDLIDAVAARVVLAQRRRIAVGEPHEGLDALRHERSQLAERRIGGRPQRLARHSPHQPPQVLVRGIPVAAIEGWDVPGIRVRHAHGPLCRAR